MKQEILEKISKTYNLLEFLGKTVVPDAMITVHRKEGLKGIWWYRPSDGKLEYSEKARSHFDDEFNLADPESRDLVRGRVGMFKGKPYLFIYTHDFSDERVPGSLVADLVTKLERSSGLELDVVVDEEGRDLVHAGRV